MHVLFILISLCIVKSVILPFQYSDCSVVGFDKFTYCSYIPVDSTCFSSKALLHTLFHLLGRYHEHERSDREKYVHVIEENIIEGM